MVSFSTVGSWKKRILTVCRGKLKEPGRREVQVESDTASSITLASRTPKGSAAAAEDPENVERKRELNAMPHGRLQDKIEKLNRRRDTLSLRKQV